MDRQNLFNGLGTQGKAAVSLWVLVMILTAGLYFWVMLGAVTVGDDGANSVAKYTWSDGQLVLHGDSVEYEGSGTTNCSITPERGARRTVAVPAQKSAKLSVSKIMVLRPWFSGSAAVTCDDAVDIAQGAGAIRARTVRSEWFNYFAVVLVVGPLVALSTRRKRRAEAR